MPENKDNFDELWAVWESPRKDMAHLYEKRNSFLFLLIRALGNDDFKYYLTKIHASGGSLKQKVKKLFEDPSINESELFEYVKNIKQSRIASDSDYLQEIESTINNVTKANCRIRNDNLNTAVNNLVRNKASRSFETFSQKIEEKLIPLVREYSNWSWFNQKSNDILESYFIQHDKVLPCPRTRGIHHLDFFVHINENWIPFDLKTTFISEDFLEGKRAADSLKSERETILEQGRSAINFKIGKLSNDEILSKISGNNEILATEILAGLMEKRSKVYDDIENSPLEYATWLFENQGERLFANNNRLFIVLASEKTLEKPWWMKSNFAELEEKINSYLASDLGESFFPVTYHYNKTPEFEGDYSAIAGLILLRE